MGNARLDKAQAKIKTAKRNVSDLRYVDDTTLMEESKEELNSFLMKVKEKSKRFGLKLNQEFPGSLVVKTSPSNTGGVGSIPGQGAKIPHASKNQTIKHKKYCNKFN